MLPSSRFPRTKSRYEPRVRLRRYLVFPDLEDLFLRERSNGSSGVLTFRIYLWRLRLRLNTLFVFNINVFLE